MTTIVSFLKNKPAPQAADSDPSHTVQLFIEGKNLEIEGKKEGNIFRNRGQIEGILKVNGEQNMFVYIQRFKGPAIPKHRLPSKYTIVKTPSGRMQNIIKVNKKK